MKVAIYARVSTSDGRQHTDNQVDELVAWAARLGHEVTQVYCDRVTGTKAAEERPALAEALRDAHERRYDVLLCWALDRLSRGGIGATAAILARLKGAGVGLRSYKESWLDTSTPAIGELLTAVFAWVARQEADRIRDRVHAGLDRAKRRGTRAARPSGAHGWGSTPSALGWKFRRLAAFGRLPCCSAVMRRRFATGWPDS